MRDDGVVAATEEQVLSEHLDEQLATALRSLRPVDLQLLTLGTAAPVGDNRTRGVQAT